MDNDGGASPSSLLSLSCYLSPFPIAVEPPSHLVVTIPILKPGSYSGGNGGGGAGTGVGRTPRATVPPPHWSTLGGALRRTRPREPPPPIVARVAVVICSYDDGYPKQPNYNIL
ncbi:hypothetical protein EE612_058930 [Oryza sativa]|nr:hypothetical protein EE612_058930 [Oryza sativa]